MNYGVHQWVYLNISSHFQNFTTICKRNRLFLKTGTFLKPIPYFTSDMENICPIIPNKLLHKEDTVPWKLYFLLISMA